MNNLVKKIPLYYKGNQVGLIPFDQANLILKSYLDNIITNQQKQIVFINKQQFPILTIKYPQEELIMKIDDQVEKIILIETKENIDVNLIFSELTSPLGNPPIYGFMDDQKNLNIILSFAGVKSEPKKWGLFNANQLIQIAVDLGFNRQFVIENYNDDNMDVCTLIKNRLIQIGHML